MPGTQQKNLPSRVRPRRLLALYLLQLKNQLFSKEENPAKNMAQRDSDLNIIGHSGNQYRLVPMQ